MPRNFQATPNSNETITRPISLEVATQIKRLLELPDNTVVTFPGGMETVAQTGSTIDAKQGGDLSTFSHDNQFRMDVVERFNDDDVLSTTVHYQDDAQPYFLDKAIGVELRPVYSQTQIDFNISIRTKDKDMAARFRDTILARSAQQRTVNLHELHYSYAVPLKHLQLLEQIHTMREATAGYGEDFSTWVASNITGRATNLTNLIGTAQTLVIQEHQIECTGWFDWEAAPDNVEKDGEAGAYSWTLTYKLNYAKVIGTAARWPIMVHNAIMPHPWISTPVANGTMIDPDRRTRRGGKITEAFKHFTHLYTDWCAKRIIDGVQIPVFDEWEPRNVYPDTSSVVTILMSADLTAPRSVLDLGEGDLGEYLIDPDVLEFMRGEYRWLNSYNESIIHIGLYEGSDLLDDGSLMINDQLNITAREPLDPRKVYHLRIALVNDLTALSKPAMERFRRGGKGAQKLLMTLQWKLLQIATLPDLLAGKYLSVALIQDIAKKINAKKGIHYTGVEYRMLTVGYFTITAQRNDHANRTNPPSSQAPEADGTDGSQYPVPGCDGGYPI